MTNSQKILIAKLLTGHFLRKTKHKGKTCYVLYDAKINPLEKIHERTVDQIDKFIDPEIRIWKKDRHGNITLNLNSVRQLHGRSILKQFYKKRHELADTSRIYKSRNHRKKIKTEANEKVHYLF